MTRKRGSYKAELARQPAYQRLYKRLHELEGRYEATVSMLLSELRKTQAQVRELERALLHSKNGGSHIGQDRLFDVPATTPRLWTCDDT